MSPTVWDECQAASGVSAYHVFFGHILPVEGPPPWDEPAAGPASYDECVAGPAAYTEPAAGPAVWTEGGS